MALLQASFRRRILRAVVGRCLLESFEAKEILGNRAGNFYFCGSAMAAVGTLKKFANYRFGLSTRLPYC